MPSENGRTFTADLERATAEQRRNYGHALDSLERAEQKIAQVREKLEKFATAMAEATVSGSPQPPAALDLQRQLADAEKMAAAFKALFPERKRLLQEVEGKWVAENVAPMRDRFTQVFQAELIAARAWAEAHAATEALRQDIATAAREFSLSLPGGPLITPMLQLLESAVTDWTSGRNPHSAPPANGLVAVRRLPADQYRPLKPGHRLQKQVAATSHVLEGYAIGETFGATRELAELWSKVHLVEQVPAGGAA